VLDGYAILETETLHPENSTAGQDELLGPLCQARYLEEVSLSRTVASTLDFEPKGKSRVCSRSLTRPATTKRSRLVQRPHGRSALCGHGSAPVRARWWRSLRRTTCRKKIQLGPRAQARIRPRVEPAADRLQTFPIWFHRGFWLVEERRLSPSAGLEPNCWPSECRRGEHAEFGDHQPGPSSGPKSSLDWQMAYCQAHSTLST